MKIGFRHAILGVLATLLLSAVLGAALYHSYLVGKVARYRSQLRAAGEKLSLSEVAPLPVPLDRNSAGIVRQASALFNTRKEFLDNIQPPAMRMVAPGKAMVGWAQPDVQNEKTNTWEQAEAALEPYQQVLEDLPRIIDRPVLDFDLDYAQGPSLLLPHLANLKRAAQCLSAAALCDLHNRDATSAVIEVRSMLALAKGMREERLPISQLVRIAVAQIALANTWELLQSTELTEAQLAEIQSDWTTQDFIQPAEASLILERASNEQTLAGMRASSAQFRNLLGMGGSGGGGSGNWFENVGQSTALKAGEAMWRFSWSYIDELRALHGHQVLIESLRQAHDQAKFQPALLQQKLRLAELGLSASRDNTEPSFEPGFELRTLFSRSVISLQGLIRRVQTAEAAREMAVTATAIKRFQLRYASTPPSLASLVPEFVPSIPRDPIDGQLLRYRLDASAGFLLYSIGDDGKDNGADPSPAPTHDPKSLSWQNGHDWVWPRPATADEIGAYNQKNAKRKYR